MLSKSNQTWSHSHLPNAVLLLQTIADILDWKQAPHGRWAPSSVPLRVRVVRNRSWKVSCTLARRLCRAANSGMDEPARLKLEPRIRKSWGTNYSRIKNSPIPSLNWITFLYLCNDQHTNGNIDLETDLWFSV